MLYLKAVIILYEKGELMQFKPIYYIYLFVVMLIIYSLYYIKLVNKYEKNLKKYMKKKEENYFEVRYVKKLYFLNILVFIPPCCLCIDVVLNSVSPLSFVNKYGLIISAALMLIIPLINYLYKVNTRIVYNYGQITYYLGDKLKVSGNIDDIDRKYTYVYQTKGTSTAESCIMFNSGEKINFSRNNMDCGYKLEAFLKKRGMRYN